MRQGEKIYRQDKRIEIPDSLVVVYAEVREREYVQERQNTGKPQCETIFKLLNTRQWAKDVVYQIIL
jgi:hypothetical protein